MAPKRPLVESGPVSEFGAHDPSYAVEDRALDFTEDMLYVPGFSDQRRQRDIELGEFYAGTRRGEDVSTLGANVYWVRRTAVGGTVDARKIMGAKNAGYRPVHKGDIGLKPWLPQMGAGWQVTPDGCITNAAGDLQLMVLEGVAAANRAKAKQDRWLARSSTVQVDATQKGAPQGTEITMRDGTSVVDHAKHTDTFAG